MASKPDPKGQYKNGQRKASWREGKKIAIYMDGSWHHFGQKGAPDFRSHGSEKRRKAYKARHASNEKGDSPRAKAFRVYNRITWSTGGMVENFLTSSGFTVLPNGSFIDPEGNNLGQLTLEQQEALKLQVEKRMNDGVLSGAPLKNINDRFGSVTTTRPYIPNIGNPTYKESYPGGLNTIDTIRNVQDSLSQLRSPISKATVGLTGAGIQTASTINPFDINVGGAALGGALQGIAGGGILGGVIGGIGGFASAVNNKVDYEESERRKNKSYIQNNTVQPFSGLYETGGQVQAALNLSVAQTEEGESMVLPDGTFTKVAAKKKHSEMEDDDITDLLPDGTLIFSEKLQFDPSEIEFEEDLLGYGTDVYKEGQVPNKITKVLFTDIIGDKKMSYSDAAKMIAKKYPINTENDKDVLTMKTNNNNMINRTELFGKLFELQELQKDPELNDMEELNSIPKYSLGDIVGDPNRLYLANDDIFKNLYNQTLDSISRMEAENQVEFDLSKKEYSGLNNRLVNSNVLNTGVNLLGNLAQSTTEDPLLKDAAFANMIYKQTPNSIIDNQIQQLRGNSNSMASGLLNSGLDPRLVPSLMAQNQDASLDAESRLRSAQLSDQMLQDRSRGKFLQDIRNSNNLALATAGNDERTNRNQVISNVAKNISSGIVSNSSLDSSNIANQRDVRKQFNDARNTLEEARRQADARNANFSAMDQYLRENMISKLSNNSVNNSTVQPIQPQVNTSQIERLPMQPLPNYQFLGQDTLNFLDILFN